MSNIEDKLNELNGEVVQKAYSNAEAKIEINIQGTRCIGKVSGNKTGMLMAASCIIDAISKRSGLSREEVVAALKGLWSISNMIDCESSEQADVMEQIIKNGLKPEK